MTGRGGELEADAFTPAVEARELAPRFGDANSSPILLREHLEAFSFGLDQRGELIPALLADALFDPLAPQHPDLCYTVDIWIYGPIADPPLIAYCFEEHLADGSIRHVAQPHIYRLWERYPQARANRALMTPTEELMIAAAWASMTDDQRRRSRAHCREVLERRTADGLLRMEHAPHGSPDEQPRFFQVIGSQVVRIDTEDDEAMARHFALGHTMGDEEEER